MDNQRQRWLRRAVTAVVAAAAGLLFVTSSVTSAGTNLRSGGTDDLRSYITAKVRVLDQERSRVQGVSSEVDQLSAKYLGAELRSNLTALNDATGMTAVSGSALVVTLNDAPHTDPIPAGLTADDFLVHQQDVQAVVNAFWRGGATAIQVMEKRLTAKSAIRCVGNTLYLDGRVYSPPFVITAIGDVTKLQEALDSEPAVVVYRQYADSIGLGWQVAIANSVTIQPYDGSIAN